MAEQSTDGGFRHGAYSASAFALVFLLVLAIGAALNLKQARVAFDKDLDRLDRRVAESRQRAANLLDAAAAAYQALETFDSSRLASLTGLLMASRPSIELIAYASWVPAGQRALFVEEMVDEGYPGYVLRGRQRYPLMQGGDGSLAVRFVEPYSPANVTLLGFDLVRDDRDIALLQALVEGGHAGLLPGWRLPGRSAELIYLAKPTFRGLHVPQTATQRAYQADGFFLLAMDPDGLIAELQDLFGQADLTLVDAPGRGRAGGVRVRFGDTWLRPLQLTGRLALAGSAKQLSLRRDLLPTELLSPLTWAMAGLLAGVAVVLLQLFLSRQRARAQSRLKEQAIEEERRRAQGTLQSLSDAVLVTDDCGRVLYSNPVAAELLGIDGGAPRGGKLSELLSFVDAETGRPIDDSAAYLAGLQRGDRSSKVLLASAADGLVPVNNRITTLSDDHGAGLVMVMRDVRVERELTNRLQYQASHDPLTRLWNRGAFEARVGELVDRLDQGGDPCSLLFIDLDRFKLVNDTAGHRAGDELLKVVANTLAAVIREDDMLARMGGDEFAILLRGQDIDAAAEVATRLRRSLEALRFRWQESVHDVRASIGVVPISSHIGSLADLMAYADLACHAAKEAGRNTIHLYRPDDRVVSHSRAQMHYLQRIQAAIDSDGFALYWQQMQPVGGSGRAPIHEFLLRMVDERGGLVAPGLFLPSAERYDMMPALDQWVISQAFRMLGDRHRVPSDLVCSINLSGQSLSDPALFPAIEGVSRRYRVDPARVCFEVTETAAISNMGAAIDLLSRLRSGGYRIMLDDFGAGMSSLGYLRQLKVDFIKIDGQFVHDLVGDPLAASMVRMTIEIARILKVQTVAEKIESVEVLQRVTELGIDYVQGYHLHRPEPVPEGGRADAGRLPAAVPSPK